MLRVSVPYVVPDGEHESVVAAAALLEGVTTRPDSNKTVRQINNASLWSVRFIGMGILSVCLRISIPE